MKKIFLLFILIPMVSLAGGEKKTCSEEMNLQVQAPIAARFLLTSSDGRRLGTTKPIHQDDLARKAFKEFKNSEYKVRTPDGFPKPSFVFASTSWIKGGMLTFDMELVLLKNHFPKEIEKEYGKMDGIFIKRSPPRNPWSYDSLVVVMHRSSGYYIPIGTEYSDREIYIKGKKGDRLKFKIKMDSCENDDAKRLVVEKVK